MLNALPSHALSIGCQVREPESVGRGRTCQTPASFDVGAAAGGLIAEAIGLRAVFVISGVLILSTVVGMVWVTDAAIAAAEDDTDG